MLCKSGINDPVTPPDITDEDNQPQDIDPTDGFGIRGVAPNISINNDDDEVKKYYVSGIKVSVASERVQYYGKGGRRRSYDILAKQNIKFLGGMDDEVFVIEVKENQALYSDDGREFSEEFPLYNEGEERCKLYFELTNNKIIVKTESSHFIYGGKGVLFDGVYKKLNLSDN